MVEGWSTPSLLVMANGSDALDSGGLIKGGLMSRHSPLGVVALPLAGSMRAWI